MTRPSPLVTIGPVRNSGQGLSLCRVCPMHNPMHAPYTQRAVDVCPYMGVDLRKQSPVHGVYGYPMHTDANVFPQVSAPAMVPVRHPLRTMHDRPAAPVRDMGPARSVLTVRHDRSQQ